MYIHKFLLNLMLLAAPLGAQNAYGTETLCAFPDQDERKLTLFQAFAQVTKYYAKAPDVDYRVGGA